MNRAICSLGPTSLEPTSLAPTSLRRLRHAPTGLVAWCSLAVLALAPGARAQDTWQPIGPEPISSGVLTGRVAAIACSATDPNRYYAGGADGGVWRTDDGGAKWLPVGDGFPSTAIGALALDPRDDRVVYAGTGEANFANHSRYGLGVMRSRDAGGSWEQLAVATFAGRCFARLRVDPSDPRVLWAAVTPAGGFPAKVAARNHPGKDGPVGIFVSRDSGDTWQHVAAGAGLPNAPATDVALDPSNPRTIYAAIGDIFGGASNGIYRSTNGGASFSRLAGGLPASIGRITLALSPSNPRRIYAQLVNPSSSSGGSAGTLGVYRTDDGGSTWNAIAGAPSHQATYGWYLCTSVVHPTSPDTLLIGGLTCHRSTNSGSSWTTVTPPHVDLHALEFDAARRLVCGNDGGVHRSSDLGTRWDSLNATLGLIQFYAGISIDPSNPLTLWGGLQDNGSVKRTTERGWISVLGGDGGYTSIDSTGARVFVEYQGTGNLFRSVNGSSFQQSSSGISGRNCFLPPHEVHPGNPMHMIYGTERVFRSTNGGTSWSAIGGDLTGGGSAAIRALAWSPSNERVIWAATNDGRVQVTEDLGQTWRLCLTGVPGWPRTTRELAVHPTDPQRAWLAVSSFGVDQVRATSDAGRTWRSIDGTLPDVPANTIAVDIGSGEPAILYLGTDQGVWRSIDDGRSWQLYAWGLPNAPVVDLRVDARNGRLIAATQGRGAWQVRLIRRDAGLPFARKR